MGDFVTNGELARVQADLCGRLHAADAELLRLRADLADLLRQLRAQADLAMATRHDLVWVEEALTVARRHQREDTAELGSLLGDLRGRVEALEAHAAAPEAAPPAVGQADEE